ncbi:MAG TPA: DNA-directed RNA polymerase subunit omega [bacterium]
MSQVPIEDLRRRCGGVYKLVLLAARRAKELASGAPKLIESSKQKVTSVALDEILDDKVVYEAPELEEGAGKKGRAGKKDEKKRAQAA